jgi:hypothetical protein
VFGIDITRSPHPRALLILSPFLSGGIFLIGSAYFHPELMERFFALGHLDSALRLVVLLIIGYATGMILSAAVVLPFMVLTYGFSYVGTIVLVSLVRPRLKIPTQPSSRPAFRRTAGVVLGGAMAPQAPDANAAALVERLLAFFGRAANNQASEPRQGPISDEAQLKLEAMKIFAPDFEEQWNDIHKGLYQLQMKDQNPSEAVMASLEPTLSVAVAIIVWRWLSFPVPLVLQWAAIMTFAYMGLALLLLGIGQGFNYMDGSSLQSFLFEQLLNRSKGAKVE